MEMIIQFLLFDLLTAVVNAVVIVGLLILLYSFLVTKENRKK